MIFIKIIIDIICGALFSLGGWHILWMRRYLMPFIMGTGVSLSSHTWWLGLTVLPAMGTLCLGYFRLGWFGRGLWLGLQSLIIGIGALLFSHLAWYIFVPYVLIAFVLGSTLYNLTQEIGDAIFGCWLGIILLFIK